MINALLFCNDQSRQERFVYSDFSPLSHHSQHALCEFQHDGCEDDGCGHRMVGRLQVQNHSNHSAYHKQYVEHVSEHEESVALLLIPVLNSFRLFGQRLIVGHRKYGLMMW